MSRMTKAALVLLLAPAIAFAQAVPGPVASKAKAEKTAKADKAAADNPDKTPASAQQHVLYEIKDANGIFKFDYGVPTSPAMSLLGLTTDTTPPSTSLTDLVVALPTLYGSEAGQSLALDFPAARLFEPRSRSTFDMYTKGSQLYRIGYRTRLGLAAMNGNDGGGDASKQVKSRLAFGFSTSLFDNSDPLVVLNDKGGLLLRDCLTPIVARAQPLFDAGPIHSTVDEALIQAQLDRIYTFNENASDPLTEDQRQEALRILGVVPDIPKPTAAPPQAKVKPAKGAEAGKRLAEFRDAFEAAKKQGMDAAQLRLWTALLATEEAVVVSLAAEDSETAPAPASAPVTVAQNPAPEYSDARLRAGLKDREIDLKAKLVVEEAKDAGDLQKALEDANVLRDAKLCTESAARKARFAMDLDVGLGVLAQGKPGRLEHLETGGSVLWAAFKLPLGEPHYEDGFGKDSLSPLPDRAWALAIAARASWDEHLQSGDKATPEFRADTVNAWIGLERLTPTHRLTAQYGWLDIRARDALGKPFEKSGERYLVSGQFQLRERSPIWLGLTYGNGYGTVGELKADTLLATITYGTPAPPDLTAH